MSETSEILTDPDIGSPQKSPSPSSSEDENPSGVKDFLQRTAAWARSHPLSQQVKRDDSSSSSESDPGVRMKGRAALRRAVKERKAIEEMRRESMHGKLMQVLTSFWTRDQHPDWSVAAKDILRKHVDQIQDTCREAKRLKHTCEALVLLCAEDYQTRLKNKVDDVQKKQMWDDYKARALLQVPQQPRIVPYTGYDPKTAQTPRQRKVVKLPKSGERNQPPFTSRTRGAVGRLVLLDQGQLSPRGKYLQVCTQHGIRPALEPLMAGQSNNLSMANQNLTDHDVLALLPVIEDAQNLNAVNFSGNSRLSDQALIPLFRAFSTSAATLRHLSLQGVAMGPAAQQMLAELLMSRAGFVKLASLDLREVSLQRKGFQSLAQSIAQHRGLTDLNLSSTGFVPCGPDGKTCISLLMQCPQLSKLDLSWNCLDTPALLQLGQALSSRRALQHLNLAAAARRSSTDRDLPIEHFLELLAMNRALLQLDISMNHMDYRAALILEDALERTCIRTLSLKDNPLGQTGLRSILRLLCGKESGLCFLSMSGCYRGGAEKEAKIFNFVNPSGRYELDLTSPYDRSLLRMLYKKCERIGQAATSAFQEVSFKGPFHHPEKKDGRYQVPETGRLNFTFACDWRFNDEECWNYGRAIHLNWTSHRFFPRIHKTAQLLHQWRLATDDPETQTTILEVLGKDFVVSSALLREMCALQPDQLPAVLNKLMHCVNGGISSQYLAMMMAPTVKTYLRVVDSVKKLISWTPENPTGNYYLDLANPADFALSEQILVLNHWEIMIEENLGYVDSSQYGNRCHLRNMCYAGRKLPFQDVKQFILPMSDSFSFDYVSCKRPNGTEPTLDVDEFQKFLKSLARRNSLDTKLRLQVLRSVGWLLYLKAYQLRLLLGIFEDEFRSICAASLLFRVVDMQNEKIFRCAFDATQFSLLQKSVGYLACFPYIQPEQWTVDLDLTQYDQRRVVQCLWTLAEKERMDNLTQIVYLSAEKVQLNNADWVPPISWCSVENVPTSGHMKVTYRGGKDIMSWPTRKKLYEQFTHGQLQGSSADVNWWSSLKEAPKEVVQFLQLLLRRFKDFDQAFTFIDGVKGNGVINLKELTERVQRMGYKEFQGAAAVPLIQKVFRFLDPDNSGSISRKEWSTMSDLQKEVLQQLEEFAIFLHREFPFARDGKLQNVWPLIDRGGLGKMPRKRFKAALQEELGFFGAAGVLAEFLDVDQKGFVCAEDLLQLRRFTRGPRSHSFSELDPETIKREPTQRKGARRKSVI
ncbi:Tonsoku-like protein (Inhibitor of kappa B-related protein) (I-kappa-B-related protein) (IkappaBR) (NF-kappa-B inhibitor-like protein 2) (Nuclear factor of kappa light polypeptide gene enhancer in B-cells inhibitor-like 2) [Durusdinium trenchii]|uniref:EF-hand domain-containing protein n=1 Tax=Durusdinium trenchii TaxID=1381693 RepID=A0ABP0MEI3_9DINO